MELSKELEKAFEAETRPLALKDAKKHPLPAKRIA
jgi:hypothetical protein